MPFQPLSGASQNLDQTQRNLQDHDLRLSAARRLKINLGYSRNTNRGPVDGLYELYIGGLARSRLPILEDVRQDFNEYRVGADIDFAGFRGSLRQQSDFYKDDTPVSALVPGQFYPLDNASVATAYVRSQPMHIRTLGWMGNLAKTTAWWAMNARMTYYKSNQTADYYEAATGNAGTGPSNVDISSVIANVVAAEAGTARRPYLNGDLNLSLFPTRS